MAHSTLPRASRLPAVAACAALMALAWPGPARADVISFSGSGGGLSAEADFSLSGGTLTVTLTNTSLNTALVPTDVLTGVFFDTAHGLTPISAALPNGTVVWYGTLTDAGDGWGYGTGVSANGKNSAISATGAVNGLGHSNFSANSNALQGLDYGILPAGYTGAGANTGITGHGPLVQNSVVFTLTADAGFSLAELGSSVVFQYGTSLSETHFDGTPTDTGGNPGGGGSPGNGGNPGGSPGAGGGEATPVPEPASVALLGLGLAGGACWLRRRLAAA